MPHSTPIDELTTGEQTDEERVKRIMAEMNADGAVQPNPGLPAPLPRVISEPPVSVSTGEMRMDPGTSRAHVIGGSSPSLADFQSMFQQIPPGMAPIHNLAPSEMVKPAKKTVWKVVTQSVMDHIRSPMMVGAIIFFLNLPVVTSILSRYASWMYLSSGEISIGGLLVKALLAATLFALYQGISVLFEKE